MKKLIGYWNNFPVFLCCKNGKEITTKLMLENSVSDPWRVVKSEIISRNGYFITIKSYQGKVLPMDMAFFEIVEKEIRLYVPEFFNNHFVIMNEEEEIELKEEELIYILNASLSVAISSIWESLDRECYLEFLKKTVGK